jgi:hypothetical protein
MPNDALITALEGLRDTYSQRQRATNSLLAALRGVTGSLGTAGRTLSEYAGQSPGLDRARLSQAQEAFDALRLKDDAIDPVLPDLRREVKAITAVLGALREALTALRGDVVDVVRLGHAYNALQAAKVQDDAITALMPALEEELEQAQRALGETFGWALRDALADQGIEVVGRPPRFEVRRFDIAADFAKRSASLSYGKNVVTPRVPLSVDAVIRAYQHGARAIMGRNEDGVRWIEQFYAAWETARSKRRGAGGRANIVDCYYELTLMRQSRAFHSEPSKHSFVDYSRAQFAYDFFEFTQRQRHAYEGRHVAAHNATKSQADSADRSIWIVEGNSPHDGRYMTPRL